MLIPLVIVLALALIAALWMAISTRRHATRLQAESHQQLTEAHAEHEKRVGRLQRKIEGWRERGHLDFAADLLPALDALGHALDQAHKQPQMDALREGLKLVDRELSAVLAKHGIEKCCPQPGEAFDPAVHEAVAVEGRDGVEPGAVVECLRPGYVHDQRVLRPASVAVAPRSLPAATDAPPDQAGTSPTEADESPDDVSEDDSASRL